MRAMVVSRRKRVLGIVLPAIVVALISTVIGGASAGAQESLLCGGLEATIVGTDGDDVLTGTSGRDVIVGLAGNDIIRGLSGSDTICGGPGRDRVLGGKGADTIFGGDEGDKLFGDAGADEIFGERGNDLLVGGLGDDVLDGGKGRRDRLRGRAGSAVCTDPQAGTSMDAVCKAPKPPTEPIVVESCEASETNETINIGLATGLYTNKTTVTQASVSIQVLLIDADGVRYGEALDGLTNVRAGETVRWVASSFDDGTRVASCRASFDVFDFVDPDFPGSAWNVELLSCGEGIIGLAGTGRATNLTGEPVSITVMVYFVGADGVRLGDAGLSSHDDVLAGETVEFVANSFLDSPPRGLSSCHVFVRTRTL